MKLAAKDGETLEITSVVLKTEHISVVRDGRKFFLVNNKNVTDGKEWVSPKNAREQRGVYTDNQ